MITLLSMGITVEGMGMVDNAQKVKDQIEACELILKKTDILLQSHERLKARIEALRNTAIQSRRKADLLLGQARSTENTARNLENRLNEDVARLNQITKAALILQATINTDRV